MSTLDVIALVGGRPANFCDLGGGGDAEGVVDALEVITGDPQVKSIFFNIFGGITRCDEVARGILAALDRMTIEHPIVVRLDGTNAEEGRQILRRREPANLYVEPTMLDAARRAVELARDGRLVGARARPTARRRSSARARDLDLIAAWIPAGATVLDVATGGGHVARRLREQGHDVVTVDPAPGMQPDVVCRAEDLPFADGSFDAVVTRIAPHHFSDLPAAVAEMARVSGDRRDRRGHALLVRRGRAGREAARPDPRALVLGGGVARVPRRRRPRGRGGRVRRQAATRSSAGSRARAARATRPSACAGCSPAAPRATPARHEDPAQSAGNGGSAWRSSSTRTRGSSSRA